MFRTEMNNGKRDGIFKSRVASHHSRILAKEETCWEVDQPTLPAEVSVMASCSFGWSQVTGLRDVWDVGCWVVSMKL